MPQTLGTKGSGIVAKLLSPFKTRAIARASRSPEAQLEQSLAAFSREDQQKIRAYLALNPGDTAFIRALQEEQ